MVMMSFKGVVVCTEDLVVLGMADDVTALRYVIMDQLKCVVSIPNCSLKGGNNLVSSQ